MTTARCPACGAALADGAPWCTLCYTDLRAPAAASERPSAPEADPVAPARSGGRHAASSRARHAASTAPAPAAPAPAAPVPASVSGSPVDLLDPLTDPLTDPRLDAPVTAARDAVRGPAAWPCLACGASVALEHDACPHCGTAFLASVADSGPVLDLPLVGPLRPASPGSRAWVMVGGGLFICVALVAVLSLIGLFL
ncbi:MAG TPA: hypothetical protein VFH66_00010 [Mycobacteriales bacterium]|nr:hypothetical protein [Mycobacteriales bacterium]